MKINKMVLMILILLLIVAGLSCRKGEQSVQMRGIQKIRVVVSLYPLYDFVRNVGKEKVEAELLLPPGIEPHSFDPKPADVFRLHNADIFIYTNKYMEPWVEGMIKGMDNKNTLVLDSSKGIVFRKDEDEDHEAGYHAEEHGHEQGSRRKHGGHLRAGRGCELQARRNDPVHA